VVAHIVGARLAGIRTSGYGASLEDGKATFAAALEAYRTWLATVPEEQRPR
jgi:hypothetical protein